MIKEFTKRIPLFEEVQSDKKAAIEAVLDIKGKFILCNRCGQQLHHMITTCNRCGNKNPKSNGFTVRQIIYSNNNRTFKKYPDQVPNDMLWSAYEKRLTDAGVTQEEWLDYIKTI